MQRQSYVDIMVIRKRALFAMSFLWQLLWATAGDCPVD